MIKVSHPLVGEVEVNDEAAAQMIRTLQSQADHLQQQVQHWQHMAMFMCTQNLIDKGIIRPRLIVTAEAKEFPFAYDDIEQLHVNVKTDTIIKLGNLFGEDPPTLLTIQKPDGLGFMLVPLSKAQELAEAARDRLQINDQGRVQ